MATNSDGRQVAQPACPVPEGLPGVALRGARVHALTEGQCVWIVLASLAKRRGGWIQTLNLDHLRRIAGDPVQAELAGQATLTVADGMPLVWASRLRGTPLPERVAGSRLVWSLTAGAAGQQRSVFLLGGEPGTAAASAAALRRMHPTLRIAGVICPPFGFEDDPEEIQRIRHSLRSAQPDIVFVALGAPKQDQFIRTMREELPACWWIGVGITFSFISGRIRQAPEWVQSIGLEWLHRLAQEPRRLARRYLVDGVPFAIALLLESALTVRRPDRGRS